MLHGIVVDRERCAFRVRDRGFANAVRRALLSDVRTHAPDAVFIRKNTSCQNDEYIAHRLSMIPFRPRGEMGHLRLRVADRTAHTADLEGDAFYATTPMPILKMEPGQSLDLDVHFASGTAQEHTKFSHIGPVHFAMDDAGVELKFGMITDESPAEYLLRALDALDARVSDALVHLDSC